MHSIKDFCRILNVHPVTMHRYLVKIKPLFRISSNANRKRLYNDAEAKIVLEYLKKHHPKRFKKQSKSLSNIFFEVATNAC